jgi:2-hydroxychromene-2-carboxylate isomerase
VKSAALALALVACGAPERAPVSTVAIPTSAPTASVTHTAPIAQPSSEDPLADVIGGADLTPREREEWGGYVTTMLAPCAEVAVSVAECVTRKRACAACAPAARFLLREVRAGAPRERVERDYRHRFDPSFVRTIPVDGSPTLGAENAHVTIVVFSDFECPACNFAAPKLDEVAKSGRSVRLVYKFVALPQHTHAELAARAAIAASAQGRFWEMHHAIFAHQSAMEQRDLEQHARELGLDMKRFAADLHSATTTARIDADAALSRAVGLSHTPTVFVEGRELDDVDHLAEWVADFLPR